MGRNLTSRVLPRPWQDFLPQKTVGTTPRPRLIGSQIHWLSLFGGQPIVAHGVGVPSNHSTTELSIFKGRDSGQSDHVVLSQPAAKLTVPSQPLNFPLRQRPW